MIPGNGEDEGVRPTGKFRVYLGAAAGVGKTCAMLDEGWRRFQRGADVVVGYVETHKRPYTVEQLRDLPVVPRKKVRYREADWEEMDVDAVVARRPKVALVDEWPIPTSRARAATRSAGKTSSRSSTPASRSSRRSTSSTSSRWRSGRADHRGRGARRVPDWVVRRADQIELIDSSADQLRRRMLHGNIYPEEKVPAALNGFFRAENLAALASCRCASWQTRRKKSCWSTSDRRVPAVNCGRRPSGSWWP